jgi:pyruvate formate lyase activating enzyme
METLATIFNIQRFSIHDGPGIRTTIFFKGCPLRCVWCQNPESHKPGPEVAFYEERCVLCFMCKEACPEDGIVEARDVRIDGQKCTACGKCVSTCENNALRMVGAVWEAHSLFSEIMKDKDFFMDSGGGITLSGGEPAIHCAFLRAFLPLVKEQGIHVNMETCGMFKFEDVESILPLLDLIYYDLKLIDPKMHRQYTGADNKNIMGNFTKLATSFPNLQARMPVVPTINDGPKNILGTVQFLKKNNLKSINLLSYHKLGEDKLRRIETDLRPLNLPKKDSRALLSAKKLFENEGICAIVSD